jgi:tyrosyl-tRNA synthetase
MDIWRDLVHDGKVHVPLLLRELGFVRSTSEGRRLIAQGGVQVNGVRLDEEDVTDERLSNATLQIGKRRFVRLT